MSHIQLFLVLFISELLINLSEGSKQICRFGYGLDIISLQKKIGILSSTSEHNVNGME